MLLSLPLHASNSPWSLNFCRIFPPPCYTTPRTSRSVRLLNNSPLAIATPAPQDLLALTHVPACSWPHGTSDSPNLPMISFDAM
jgi:hypothetical protein